MRFFGLFVCLFLFFSSLSFAQTLSTKKDSISYAIGLSIAESLKKQGVDDLNADILNSAIKESLAKATLKMDTKEAEKLYNTYIMELKAKQNEAKIMEGKNFLIENAKKPGIVSLPSGLQYEILVAGAGGPKPSASDKVKTHYHGMLIDGTVFDSSVDRGEPISFGLNQVIKGWTEGVQLMSVGDKYRFFIPYTLAYGERGAGHLIKPYASLVFEVELLGIE